MDNKVNLNAAEKAALEEAFFAIQLGEASPEELASFNDLLLGSDSARRFVSGLLVDESILREQLRVLDAARAFEGLSVAAGQTHKPVHVDGSRNSGGINSRVGWLRGASWRQALEQSLARAWGSFRGAAVGGFAAGACVAVLAVWLMGSTGDRLDLAASSERETTSPSQGDAGQKTPTGEPIYVANVVRDAGSLWSATNGRRVTVGERLRTGETVRISVGEGELEFDDGLSLYLTGPAEVEITRDGKPLIRHGRIVASSSRSSGKHTVSTVISSVSLEGPAVLAFALNGISLELHALQGDADVIAQNPADQTTAEFRVADGTAALVEVSHNARLRVSKRPLNPKIFAVPPSIHSDPLRITEEYTQAVMAARPLAYLKFENGDDGLLRDSVTGELAYQIKGGAQVIDSFSSRDSGGSENHTIDFGYGSESGSVVSLSPVPSLAGEAYTVELWVRAKHRNHGTALALFKPVDRLGYIGHGLMIELRGQGGPDWMAHKVRYLHRSATGPLGGTDLFSSANYELRKWQHIAAVKSGADVTLFVDGRVSARGSDTDPLDTELSLLLGQVYPIDSGRPFIGELDEVALYGYALSQEEIKRHHELVQIP